MKKAFCDGWDNLFHIVVVNFILALLLVGGYFAVSATLFFIPLSIAVFLFFLAVFMIPLFAVSQCMARVAAFKSITFKDMLTEIGGVWKDAMLFGLLIGAIVLLAIVGFPFYLGMKNLFGVFLAALLFWAIAVFVLSLQWFMPIRAQLGNNFRKCLKKSFIVFFDNPGFSIFMFFYNTVLVVLSLVLALLLPSFAGIILALNDAFRLRLYKYDWMEAHPELSAKEARKQVPWGELIAEDRETLGPRGFKSFIFPWKD